MWLGTVEDNLYPLNFSQVMARGTLGTDRHGDYSWRRVILLEMLQ